jgi:hypothetical protein
MPTLLEITMRKFLTLVVLTLAAVSLLPDQVYASGPSYKVTGSKPSSNYVSGYRRSNGTYVKPHYRTTADRSFHNNWSTKPNSNPYTGKRGTRIAQPSYR